MADTELLCLIEELKNKILSDCGVSVEKYQGADMLKELIYQNKTIKQRADGRYWTRFRMHGKQYSVYGRTANDCLNNLKQAIREIKRNPPEPSTPKAYTFNEFFRYYNNTFKVPINKTTNFGDCIRLHITMEPDKPLTNVTTFDLQSFINNVAGSRMKKQTYDIIREVIRYAYNNAYIPRDISATLPKVYHQREKGKALTLAEETDFLKAISGSRYEKYYLFCLMTGARREEALTITVNDVDFKAKTLLIRGTKTANAQRVIPLFAKVESLLLSIEPDKNGRYFPFQPDKVTKKMKDFSENHRLHDLRHTFATRCLEAGIDMKVVQEWLGHSNYQTTANIYTDVQEDFKKKEALRLNTFFDTHFDTHF